MKRSEIKKYWKEERDAANRTMIVDAPEHVDAPYVEHQGSTPASEEAYRKQVVHCRCLPCPIYD